MKRVIVLFFLTLIGTTFNAQDCIIDDVVVQALDCNDDGKFKVMLNFNYMNEGDEGFNVRGNGHNYGNFEYTDLPIMLGPLDGDCETNYEFVVQDNQFADCKDFAELGEICCEDGVECEIFELEVDILECHGDSSMDLEVRFKHNGTSGSGFDIYSRSGFFKHYNDNQPFTVLGFPKSDLKDTYLKVCDNDSDDCCAAIEFLTDECDSCRIWDLIVEAYECDSTGQFYIDLDFNHKSEGDSGFIVKVNNAMFGPFDYDSLYITLGPFQGGCDSHFLFIVEDVEFHSCRDSFLLDKPCCEEEDCEIGRLHFEVSECDSLGQFNVEIEFGYNGTSDSFCIRGNGHNYGTFAYEDLPVRIGPLEGDCETNHEFVVIDKEDEHCRSEGHIEKVCCDDEDCEIGDLNIDRGDCDSLGQFYVHINFNHRGTSDSFCVRGNGHNYGTYAYDNLPIRIGHLEGNCETEYEFVVIDKENEHCRAGEELGKVCCGEDECEIGRLHFEVTECDSLEQFYVDIEFDHSGTSDSFCVRGNGHNYGTFSYEDLPIRIGPLEGDCETIYEFVVFDKEHEGCRSEGHIEKVCCDEEGCEIWDLNIDRGDCDSLGQFYVHINFNHRGTSDSFCVRGNAHNYGIFAYEDLPIRVGPLEGNCDTIYHFVVIDKENVNCITDVELGKVCCDEEDCEIGRLHFEVSECDSLGQFNVEIEFGYNGTSDSFCIRGNGHNYGTFAYEDLPVGIGPLEGDCETNYEFVVIDKEDEHCRSEGHIEKVCCDDEDCEIWDLNIDRGDCDTLNQFYVHINFNHRGTSDSFCVRGNGHNYGTFSYEDLPVRIGPLEGDCETNYEFVVIDKENEHCRAGGKLGKICCGEEGCEIGRLHFEVTECDSLGQFYVDIDFEHEGTSDSFCIRGNGNNYGRFAYKDLPVRIGPLEGDCETNYEFVVIDKLNEDCKRDGHIEKVCCNDEIQCEINHLEAVALRCTSDSTIAVHINFRHSGTGGAGFDVFNRTGHIGFYQYSALPLVINNFPISGKDFEFIRVCDNDNDDCCDEVEFLSLDCEGVGVNDALTGFVNIVKRHNVIHIKSLIFMNEIQVRFVSVLGQQIKLDVDKMSNEINIDISSLIPGVYFMVLNNEKGSMTYKFIR